MFKIKLILSVLVLVLAIASARNPNSTTTCSISNHKSKCEYGVCPSIVACINEYSPMYSNIVITVPDGNFPCKQIDTYFLKYDLNIDLRPEGQKSVPSFTCQGKTSFLKLKTAFVFSMTISNVVIQATLVTGNRGSLININSSTYIYPNTNQLTMNNVVLKNGQSIPANGANEAGSITLNSVSLVLSNCSITNSQSTGSYPSSSVMNLISGSLTINNSTISNSISSNSNYGINFSGDNIFIYNSIFNGGNGIGHFINAVAKSVYVKSSKFTNNYSKYGSCFNLVSSSIMFDSNVFDRNFGQYGSALFVSSNYNYQDYYFINNNLTNNIASDAGTLFLSTQGNHYLTGSIFENNVAWGAADIFFYQQRITLLGGTFINSSSSNEYSPSQYPQFPMYVVDMVYYEPYIGIQCIYNYQTLVQNGAYTYINEIE
ncbi:hypothetical protein PPL_00652 [Heterostelium album PN500]|uniref:Uncharacterized protein n=1 Tax=Heterostelium pallidum (strain ATCC 26659 / Pp 5 / PN500) TaxID=670386 RepID=D3AX24_HETP5|nr:hypothetical protein PPL_00652 [Heterostelium album PN500]EFA86847.1 hypothetical protein PPL_00652 [Heterostelium album PN500]|eukprot:XP_020438950.1 hypothetical protein PPL_00652 [Heterostelium album PN500]